MTRTEQDPVADAAPAPLGATSRSRALVGPVVAAVGTMGALAVLAAVDPNAPGHYPTCPFLFLTGWYCPGCGSLRALHDLTQLDLAGAWGMNPLLVLAIPFVVASWFAWLLRSARGRPQRRTLPAGVIVALLVLVVAYGVCRNIPALAPWLAP